MYWRLDKESRLGEVLFFRCTHLSQALRDFFENLRIGADSVESRIKDTLIVNVERRLGSIIEMLRSSICIFALKKKDGLRTVLERDDVRDLRNLSINKLSVTMRLLHSMIAKFWLGDRER